MIVDYIDTHKEEFGVEPICRVLTEHGCPIAPSNYYDTRNRPPSKRDIRDEHLAAEITRVHAENYSVRSGGSPPIRQDGGRISAVQRMATAPKAKTARQSNWVSGTPTIMPPRVPPIGWRAVSKLIAVER
ncbi:hypothetical protein [Nocardia sp. NPDC005366]|uniref:hypothetical protein n=1 Tax=Nocardia sp. NPDC005366 TaxID=3156878 RepID=UPI0033B18FDA